MKHLLHLLFRLSRGLNALLLPVLLFAFNQAGAQAVNDTAWVRSVVTKLNNYNSNKTAEQLYLHFDKPYYAAGDTAWVKAYVMMGADHHPSAYSAKLYMELLDNGGQLVQRLVLPVFDGLAQGFIPLDEKKVADGSYTIRAYTNWQQNFGAGAFFYKRFSVGRLGGKTWLLTEQHRKLTGPDSSRVQLAMRFTDAKGLAVVARQMSVKVLEGTKPLLRSDISTGVDGTLTGNFSIPAKADKRNLNILVEDAADKSQHVLFPFYPSGAGGDIDLQFMPEGGNLVAGLYNKIGFKAIGEDGLGRDVTGTVTDSKGEEAATLQSIHNGMGSFVLVPQAGEVYTAKIKVNGHEQRYALPIAKAQGMALRIDGLTHADDLYVYISATASGDQSYMLLAQSKDQVYFGMPFKLNSEGYYNTRIPKSKFTTGIVNISILGADSKVICTRNVFADRHDALQVSTLSAQQTYAPGDSIAINLHVTDGSNVPVQGTFSVAVTDDAQVKDAVQTDNILSHILLASEVKGNIENPAWYFGRADDAGSKLKEKALDNLLLTQGWQGFVQEKMDAKITTPAYDPEPDFSVSGSLKNLFNKPAAGLKVTLLGNGRQALLRDTLSGKDGKFVFSDLPLTDLVAYLLKLHNKRDGTAAAGILVNEFKPTKLPLTPGMRLAPWNLNADTTLINYINKSNQRNLQNATFIPPAGTTLLKQVDITAKRVVRDMGNEFKTETFNIDEKALIAEKQASLFDVLNKKLDGFRETSIYAIAITGKIDKEHKGRTVLRCTSQFVVGSLWVSDLVVDGESLAKKIGSFRDPLETEDKGGDCFTDSEYYTAMRQFLNNLGADDVKSISLFRGQYLSLVITTRSGNALNTKTSLGTYAYRPLPVQLPLQFYSPKYSVKNTQPDPRSTIHWAPNVVTDASGNAQVSFFAAGKPSTYTVVIEGTDMQGHFGVGTKKINITQGTAELHK